MKLGGCLLTGFAVPVVLAVAGVGWLMYQYRAERYRYQVTVEIDTPRGVSVGYAVNETGIKHAIPIMMAGSADSRMRNSEAVPVDLPGGATIYMTNGAPFEWISNAYADGEIDPPFPETRRTKRRPYLPQGVEAWKELRRSHGVLTLPPRKWPGFVRFRDESDPTTVEVIAPADFEQRLGQGIRVRRITVTGSDRPLTDQIHARLPWLKTWHGYLLGDPPPGMPTPPAGLLNDRSFFDRGTY